ncbi:MAG: DUF6456 domain-containing protein [Alphaproteobacteria bacterium]
MDWSAISGVRSHAGRGGGQADLVDSAIAARDRITRAYKAMGPELGGVVVDVCGYLKGLELVERERRWPARSAKLVLRLGLAALSRHYGLTAAATGKGGGEIGHWGADNYRPSIDRD